MTKDPGRRWGTIKEAWGMGWPGT